MTTFYKSSSFISIILIMKYQRNLLKLNTFELPILTRTTTTISRKKFIQKDYKAFKKR